VCLYHLNQHVLSRKYNALARQLNLYTLKDIIECNRRFKQLSSRKDKDSPWWFSPSRFDIIAAAKVYRKLPNLVVQRVLYAMAQAKYPNRPRRAKNTWMESVFTDGGTFQLSCRIDEDNKKIVVTNIRPPSKMLRKTHRHT